MWQANQPKGSGGSEASSKSKAGGCGEGANGRGTGDNAWESDRSETSEWGIGNETKVDLKRDIAVDTCLTEIKKNALAH